MNLSELETFLDDSDLNETESLAFAECVIKEIIENEVRH